MELVVSASTGAMKTLLPKLAEMLNDEYKLQKGVREDVACLQKELEGMLGALEKVSMVPADQLDSQVKLWASELRELSYDIEDAVDAFMVRVDDAGHESTKPHGFKKFINELKVLFATAKARHDIGITIKRIKREVKEVGERRDRYMLANTITNTTAIDPRLSALYEQKAALVGIDGPRDELAKFLMEEIDSSKKQIKVVSIFGVGGLGKTTLANAVYNKFEGQIFNCRAFISVSLKPDIKRILRNMLSQLDKQNSGQINEAWDEKQLIDELRTFLKDKRYLAVIDDIWDNSAWKIIRCALVENNLGSCIIATTRKVDVAEYIGGPYKLNQLSVDDTRKLFYTRMCHCEDECPPQLKEISNKILKKCGGVPLAIITIASLLANKPKTEDEWSRVNDSIGSGLQKNQDFDEMRRILSLSYYELPAYLRSCLLYLCIYPEDFELNIEELVWVWAAEGFIHAKQGQSFRQLGESYCIELINRSMIQLVGTFIDGQVRTCRVHDMVLDLITSLSIEENFVTVLDGQQCKSGPKKVRRLSIQCSDNEDTVQQATTSLCHVRSLTSFSHINLPPSLRSFQVLRVLNLRRCSSVESHRLTGLEHLVHLRYLGLDSGNITNLPELIGNLQFLQILDLWGCPIKQLPASIVQLRQLVCLRVGSRAQWPSGAQLPPGGDGVGNMKSVQELSSINISKHPTNLDEIGSLVELRVLHICFDTWDESYEKPLVECLCSLGSNKIQRIILTTLLPVHSLDCMLDICWAAPHLRDFWAAHSTFSTLPRWIPSLENLSYLTIRLNSATQEDLHVLGDLPALCYLHLSIERALEERLVVSIDHPFQCLTWFWFDNDVMGLTFVQGTLQRMRTLDLVFGVRKTRDVCGAFSSSVIENLSALKDINVYLKDARAWEVQDALAAFKNAAETHPNRPTLSMQRWEKEDTLKGEEEQTILIPPHNKR